MDGAFLEQIAEVIEAEVDEYYRYKFESLLQKLKTMG